MTDGLQLIFAGTPEFAGTILEALIDSRHKVVAVYTQPDRRSGRGLKVRSSPVKQIATRHDIAIEQPGTLNDDAAQAGLRRHQADLMVVVAYGLLLPPAVLAIPRLGCVNVHASLLPRWRGAAPIQRAILAGDTETGVSIMQMDAGLDTGPVLQQAALGIGATDTGGTIHDRLADLGAGTLLDALDAIERGTANPAAQDDAKATYAKKLSKQEAAIDWTLPATQLARQVRAFNPWPVSHTELQGLPLRIWEAWPVAAPAASAGRSPQPGQVVAADANGIDIQTGTGLLRIARLQMAGKKPVSAADFLNARPEFLRPRID